MRQAYYREEYINNGALKGGKMHEIKILNAIDINSLKPYPQNPFEHQYNITAIINSVRDFGYNKISIGVDEDFELLYGHGMLQALKLLDWKTVPLVAQIEGLTAEQKKMYRIADNTTASGARIIKDLLRQEIESQLSFDFGDYGLPTAELLGALGNSVEQCAAIAEDFRSENPDYIKPEKMWMYVQFQTKADLDFVVSKIGQGNSRRILD